MNPTETNSWEFGGPLSGMPRDQAWLILLVVVGLCVVLSWLSYRYAVVVASRPQRALLVMLRTAFLVTLLLCLANPVRVERTTAEPPPPPVLPPAVPTGRLALVVDRSDSMTTADNRGRSRLDDALAVWRRFEPLARPVYAETQYFSFAADLRPAASLEETIKRTAGTGETRLFESVAALLKKPKEERPDAVVVLTDGVDNSGESEEVLREAALAAGVSVHFIAGTNRDRPEPFLRVRDFRAPSVALRNTEFAVETSFEAFSRENHDVSFSLWRGDRRIESGKLTLAIGSNLVPWSFRVPSGEPGRLELTLKLGDGSGERVVARSVTSVVAQQPIKVILYQGALDWGVRFFTDAVRTDPSFDLLKLIDASAGVALPPSEKPGEASVGQLTDDAAKLRGVDCVVLARVHPQQLDEVQQRALVEFVRSGGSILFTNPDPAAIAEFNRGPLAQLFPVVFSAEEIAGATSAGRAKSRNRGESSDPALPTPLFPFTVTEAGRASPIFAQAVAPDALDGRAVLTPKFAEYTPVSHLRAGAEVLAVHPTARDGLTGRPHVLLATQTFGRGRATILTTDGLWRWKLSEPSGARVVESFWQQLLLAVGRRAGQQDHLHFVNMPAQVKVGEIVSLRIGGVDTSKPPVVVAKKPDGSGVRFTVGATGDPAVPWRINWKPALPGAWEFIAAVEGDLRAHFFTTAVAEPTGELARTPTAVAALRALAASTGGLLLTDKPPLGWRAETGEKQVAGLEPVTTETRRLRWNNWTVLCVALGAFGLELILRRFWKLL